MLTVWSANTKDGGVRKEGFLKSGTILPIGSSRDQPRIFQSDSEGRSLLANFKIAQRGTPPTAQIRELGVYNKDLRTEVTIRKHKDS